MRERRLLEEKEVLEEKRDEAHQFLKESKEKGLDDLKAQEEAVAVI